MKSLPPISGFLLANPSTSLQVCKPRQMAKARPSFTGKTYPTKTANWNLLKSISPSQEDFRTPTPLYLPGADSKLVTSGTDNSPDWSSLQKLSQRKLSSFPNLQMAHPEHLIISSTERMEKHQLPKLPGNGESPPSPNPYLANKRPSLISVTLFSTQTNFCTFTNSVGV